MKTAFYIMYIRVLANRWRPTNMEQNRRIQLNIRITTETATKLDEIVEYYQENTKLGRVYKGDVLMDIIEKSYEVMNKQKSLKKRY
jgi:spore coat polysaccharide biosynthesis protein SpsF (cytidylyltransferase family)